MPRVLNETRGHAAIYFQKLFRMSSARVTSRDLA
jgi:hypothetical protein